MYSSNLESMKEGTNNIGEPKVNSELKSFQSLFYFM